MKKDLEKIRKPEGITLIALVVTIIVLLILAAVTISVLPGDSGILKNTEKAKEETEKATIIENIKIDIMDKQINNNGNISDYELKNILETKYGILQSSTSNTILDSILITNDNKYQIPVRDIYNGPLKETLVGKITSQNYGDKVIYNAPNGINTWKIFYSDNENVFLIASDYVPKNAVNLENLDFTLSGDYVFYWNTNENIDSLQTSGLQLGKSKFSMYKLNKDNNNSRCVSRLLNSDNWNNFIDKNLADFAIGGPTIEMWTSSWNEKYKDTLTLNIGSNTWGYVISRDGKEYNTNINVNNTDSLYFNHPDYETESWNGCEGYWISSPSDFGSNSLMVINNTGNVGYRGRAAIFYVLRPIVCLKTSVNGTYTDDQWTLFI